MNFFSSYDNVIINDNYTAVAVLIVGIGIGVTLVITWFNKGFALSRGASGGYACLEACINSCIFLCYTQTRRIFRQHFIMPKTRVNSHEILFYRRRTKFLTCNAC